MQRALGKFSESERRSVMGWLTRDGPFWEDSRRHEADEYLECRGDIVTDSAIAEAAYRALHGEECAVTSLVPSDWDFSPIEVHWRREAEGRSDRSTRLANWRDAAALEDSLQDATPPIRSWADLELLSSDQFRNLTFARDCFNPLTGIPFVKSAADRILVLLEILDQLACAFDEDGERTRDGHHIFQSHFTGIDDNAWFSDSSNWEKRKFKNQLTFPHPGKANKSLFCTWHGKERRLALRLHFSWPIRAGEPVYIVYAGPKLTKQ